MVDAGGRATGKPPLRDRMAACFDAKDAGNAGRPTKVDGSCGDGTTKLGSWCFNTYVIPQGEVGGACKTDGSCNFAGLSCVALDASKPDAKTCQCGDDGSVGKQCKTNSVCAGNAFSPAYPFVLPNVLMTFDGDKTQGTPQPNDVACFSSCAQGDFPRAAFDGSNCYCYDADAAKKPACSQSQDKWVTAVKDLSLIPVNQCPT